MAQFLGLRGAGLRHAISAVCGLCFLCFGYAQAVLGGLLTVPAFLEAFPRLDTINDSSVQNARIQGITVATWNIGCFVSAILTIFIGDYLGRRKTLLLGLTLWTIGEIIQSSSFSFGQLIAGRFIAGFGNGFTTATVPAYQAECVKSHRKGTILMTSAGAYVAFGLALAYWLVFAFAYAGNPSAAWRVPIAFQIIFAIVAFALLLFLPESPRWLILTGREDEALNVLSALNDEDIEGPEIRDEFLQIKDAILVMSQGSTSSITSNKDRRNLHRVVLAYFIQVFQQMSGINLVLQYLGIMFFLQTSFNGWISRLLASCAATEYFFASFIAVVGIDRFWGRRSLMMFGAAGMSGCMVLLAVLGFLWQDHRIGGTNIAMVVFIFGFSTFFAVGWQGMAWLYQVEVVPLRIRGPANALSTSANWLFNFVVVLIAPIAFRTITYNTYIIFACTNFVIIPCIYYLYPETAYRSLEEVDVLFHLAAQQPGNPWLNVVKVARSEPLWFGKKGDVSFDYEKSPWHARHVRFSSSGTTLEGAGSAGEKNRESTEGESPERRESQGRAGRSSPVESGYYSLANTTPMGAAIIGQALSSDEATTPPPPSSPSHYGPAHTTRNPFKPQTHHLATTHDIDPRPMHHSHPPHPSGRQPSRRPSSPSLSSHHHRSHNNPPTATTTAPPPPPANPTTTSSAATHSYPQNPPPDPDLRPSSQSTTTRPQSHHHHQQSRRSRSQPRRSHSRPRTATSTSASASASTAVDPSYPGRLGGGGEIGTSDGGVTYLPDGVEYAGGGGGGGGGEAANNRGSAGSGGGGGGGGYRGWEGNWGNGRVESERQSWGSGGGGSSSGRGRAARVAGRGY